MPLQLSDFKSWFDSHREEVLRDFFKFLSFRSISTDPQFSKETHETAVWVSDYLTHIGMKSSLHETSGKPVVFATHLNAGPSRPTILIYQHYDVQPVDPLNLWHNDPFKPIVKNNTVYARGAVDNKGQCFYSISAVRAFLELAKQANINLKLFIEGEEECGSKGTTAFLAEKKIDLKADHLLVIDFDMARAGVPGITLGMRGLASCSVIFSNAVTDLHSGIHGGIALNPNRALVCALARLWDEKGRVQVPGFYDGVKPFSKADLAKLDMSFNADEYTHKFGVRAFGAEDGYSPVESNWLRPVLEINGLSGGYAGAGVKTVIPAKAEVKISCRLVGEQDPEKITKSVVEFLKLHAPKGMQVHAEIYDGARAFQASLNAPVIKVVSQALGEVFSESCKFQFCGASVPIVPALVAASSADAALFGMGLADDNIHAPNEHFGLDRFEQGFLTVSRILSLFSNS
ncbi:MAG: dipeptidase [Chlamydiales bacterium]|nr:dipeptidase [Chlamydiales bacterium]